MDVKNIKRAEEFLIKKTKKDDIKDLIEQKIASWDFEEVDNCLEVSQIKILFNGLKEQIILDHDDEAVEALQWIVFEIIHDFCMTYIKHQFSAQDSSFFEKCRILSAVEVSAEQLGADENYSIPLTAAVVELSVIDNYKTPNEKINCLCSTYDLLFAEIKSAMIAVIAQTPERENEIPVINNADVIPVLMVVIIKSKLVHMLSNLFYIKSFCFALEKNHVIWDIFKSFEEAVNRVVKTDLTDLYPTSNRIIRNIDLEEYMRITLSGESPPKNGSLVDEANRRVLNLISKSTDDEQS